MLGYVQDLGWDYVHANRDFYVARYGLTEFLGVPRYCFNKVRTHFSDALGALYIRDHLLTDSKAKVSCQMHEGGRDRGREKEREGVRERE